MGCLRIILPVSRTAPQQALLPTQAGESEWLSQQLKEPRLPAWEAGATFVPCRIWGQVTVAGNAAVFPLWLTAWLGVEHVACHIPI